MSSSKKGPIERWRRLIIPGAKSTPAGGEAAPGDAGDTPTQPPSPPAADVQPAGGAPVAGTPPAPPSSPPVVTWRPRGTHTGLAGGESTAGDAGSTPAVQPSPPAGGAPAGDLQEAGGAPAAGTPSPSPNSPPVITWRARRARAAAPAQAARVTPPGTRRRGNTPIPVQPPGPGTSVDMPRPPTWPEVAGLPIEWPQQTVKILPPKAPPVKPSQSPVTIWITVASAFLTLLAVIVAIQRSHDMLDVLPWLIALLPAAGGIGNFASAVYTYRRDMEQRKTTYASRLKQWHRELEDLAKRQRDVSLQVYPPPAAVAAMVEQQSMDLGPYSLDDGDDFLKIRLGVGQARPVYTIESGQPTQQGDEPDLLVVEAQDLIRTFQNVPDCPVALPLQSSGPTCIRGEWDQVQAFTRALLVQAAAYHSPDDLRIVMVFRESEREQWSWVRWLPHLWNDSRTERFISTNEKSTIDMLRGIENALRQKAAQIALNDDDRVPVLLFVFADPDLMSARRAELNPLLRLLTNDGPRIRAYTLFLSESSRPARRDCTTIITLDRGGTSTLLQTESQQSEFKFVPDQLDIQVAESFARHLARLRTPEQLESERLAVRTPLLKMLNLAQIEQARAASLWQQAEPFKSLTVPVGHYADYRPFTLDIHRSAHGPHGLIVGIPGTGKSNFLQTLVSSLALRYHPSDMAFLIFDYKGNSQTRVFAELPHQTSVITSLDGKRAMDAIQVLQEELRRRQDVLGQSNVNDIDGYNFLRRQRPHMEPMPYIIIVADEFANVFLSNYSFAQKLFEAVNLSDNLGLHLLFATHETDRILIDQLRNITGFRLCFQVSNAEESQRVIGRQDAAKLSYPGQAYFQTGQGGVFTPLEQVRIAWSDAIYDPQGYAHAQSDFFEVATNGVRLPLNTITRSGSMTQARAIVSYLRVVAQENNIPPQRNIDWATTAES